MRRSARRFRAAPFALALAMKTVTPMLRTVSGLTAAVLLAQPWSGSADPGSTAAAARLAGFSEGVWIEKYPGEYASFKLETPSGIRIVTDPYAMDETIAPDVVTESHQDFDHVDTSRLTGPFTLLHAPGEYAVKGIRITGIPGKHNKPDAGVTNTIFVFEIDGIKIAHLASQGALLDDQALRKLQGVDVLLIQGTMVELYREQKLTGGDCLKIIDQLHPRIVIPEHGTPRIGEYFAKRLGTKVEYAPAEGIVVRKEDLQGTGVPRIVDMDRKESPPSRPTALEDLHGVPFGQLHSPAGDPEGGALIFSALKVDSRTAGTRSRLLGRWEGYDVGLPVPRDWKIVLFVQEIEGDRGTALAWMGTNLQRPTILARFPVELQGESAPVLTFRLNVEGVARKFSFHYDPASDRLLGAVGLTYQGAPLGPESLELSRERHFLVYRDYPAYLAGKRISAVAFQDPALARFGRGYLVYLPPGYDDASDRKWPLVLFFCGSGDRGTPLEDLAKASPFMYIREHGDLPAVIVAPALNGDSPSFPTEYMNAVLDQALSRYRIDPSRVTVTGLSLGGEAALRFALTNPDRIAAAALLSIADPRFDHGWQELSGFQVTRIPYQRAASVPFYVVNGGRDPLIWPEWVKKTVEALRAAGVKVEWRFLPDNGHDVWTDTYSDPAFYEWLLSKRR